MIFWIIFVSLTDSDYVYGWHLDSGFCSCSPPYEVHVPVTLLLT